MSVRRRFFVVGHTQTTDPDLSLNDLSGMCGRLDVLCRAVTSALCVSHGLRADTEVWVTIDHDDVANGPRTMRFEGATLQHFHPDERTTAALFKRAFHADVVDNGHFEAAHPGLSVAWLGFGQALSRFAEAGPVLLLDKEGVDVRDATDELLLGDGRAPGFVLSDHEPFAKGELNALREVAAGSLSVGAGWLQGHGAVALVHDEMDRRFDGGGGRSDEEE